jgi:hypothetical protein
MASFSNGFKYTAIAGADLSTTGLHRFMTVSGANAILATSSSVKVIGVLQNNPENTQACELMDSGISKVFFGATVAAGVEVMSDGAGRAITLVPGAGVQALGMTRSGAGLNEVGSVRLYPGGKDAAA